MYLIYITSNYLIRPKKICVFPIDRLTLTFFMPTNIIDRQNPEIRLRFRICFRLNNRRLTIAILMLSDKRLIETD
jgi:hypothetical protein